MKISDCARLVIRNLWAGKGRTILNMMGTAIGVASVVLVFCLGGGGEAAVSGEMEKYGMDSISLKAEGGGKLTLEDYEYLRRVMGQELELTPVYMNYAELSAGELHREAVIWGVGSQADRIYPMQWSQGRMFQQRPGESVNQAVIDETLASQLFGAGKKIGQEFTLYTKTKEASLKVTGVLANSDGNLQESFGSSIPAVIYVPVDYAMQLFGVRWIDSISINGADKTALEKKAVRAAKLLERRHQGKTKFYAENMSRQKEMAGKILQIIQAVLGAIAAVSVCVGGVGIMNSMLMAVGERRAEIGMFKALGAKDSEIMMEFLLESVGVTLLGASAGITAGLAAGGIAVKVLRLPFLLSPALILGLVLVMIGVGIICGVYPARRAAKLDPVLVLR